MKKMSINIILFILFLLSFVVLFFIYIKKNDKNTFKEEKVHEIEQRVEHEKEVVRANDKAIDVLHSRDFNSVNRLEIYKRKHDTVSIIKEQDTLINILRKKEDLFIINEKVYDTIVKNQDTIIETQKKEVKKFKRQRNIGIAIASVGAVLLIILNR